MKFAFLALGLAAIARMADTDPAPTPTPATEAVEAAAKKSIVPAKYAGKYKDGGSDPLAEFIKAQCVGKDGFEFTAFFELCRKNGLPAEKVTHYESQVAENRQGSQGRARMTLRNMLATIARKNGKLVGLNDEETEISLPKPAVSGAAAAASAKVEGGVNTNEAA